MVAAGRRRSARSRLTPLVLTHQEDAGLGVFAEVMPAGCEEACVPNGRRPRRPLGAYSSVIVLGGDANVDQEVLHPWLAEEKTLIAELLRLRTPLLGVCLGAQLIAEVAGADVGPLPSGAEIGWHEVRLSATGDPVLGEAPSSFLAFQWHGYGFAVPPGAIALAWGDAGAQAFRLNNAWGIQFHAEVTAATVHAWVETYGPAAGIDQARLAAETDRESERWNRFGRELCARFVEQGGAA